MKERLTATHKISFMGVSCYFDDEDGILWGINAFYERMIPVAVFFHNVFSFVAGVLRPGHVDAGFKFKVLEDYREAPAMPGARENEKEERPND